MRLNGLLSGASEGRRGMGQICSGFAIGILFPLVVLVCVGTSGDILRYVRHHLGIRAKGGEE